MIWEPFILALVLGIIVSSGLYFAYLWPSAEPPEPAEPGDDGQPASGPASPAPVAPAATEGAASPLP